MASLNLSTKRLQIDKANTAIVVFVAVAAFLTVFSIISARALFSQQSYQSRVIKDKSKAAKQLAANIKAVDNLKSSYQEFVGQPINLLAGQTKGSGERDGDNGKIILNALPSKYDFPALASSLEKILIERNYKVNSITGADDELAQATTGLASANPTPVEIPFSVAVSGDYASIQNLIGVLEKSIRPIEIKTLAISGNDKELLLDFSAITYYQPAKNLTITKKEVK